MANNRILIVNNEPGIINALSAILRARSYSVIAALSGEEGLEKAKSIRPDLIILDVVMPDISGFEVCAELTSGRSTRGTPVIMMSENGGSESVLKARTAGASDYIVKPFDLFTLLNKLKKFLVI